MVTEKQIIFQVHSKLVIEAFDGPNYYIEYCNEIQSSKICVIYFSSNEIYYPNTPSSFSFSILNKDRYEWKKNKFKNVSKHIFLRDIRKQWYIGGVNSKLNHPMKLLDFLKSETKDYEVYVVGSSAGGFAAILFGSLLNARRVYAFNAQLNLFEIIKSSNLFTDPILFENIGNNDLNKYYDLSSFINKHTDYYYFQSCKSKIDKEQYLSISDESRAKLKAIFFLTSNHGFPFFRINLPYILALKKDNLDKLINKTFNLIVFSAKFIGYFKTFKFIFQALFDRFKKKQLEAKFKRI